MKDELFIYKQRKNLHDDYASKKRLRRSKILHPRNVMYKVAASAIYNQGYRDGAEIRFHIISLHIISLNISSF